MATCNKIRSYGPGIFFNWAISFLENQSSCNLLLPTTKYPTKIEKKLLMLMKASDDVSTLLGYEKERWLLTENVNCLTYFGRS